MTDDAPERAKPLPAAREDSIPTRQTLLAKLKDLDNHTSWSEFFEIYWRLIYNVALKAGLSDPEAQEVVQETMIGVARKMPDFTYDAAKDSFKGWLLHLTRYRIADQFRKRLPARNATGDESAQAGSLEAAPDPASPDLAAVWDVEWEENLLHAAFARMKQRVKPEHFEIYHLHAIKGLPVREVASILAVNAALIYLVKHRLNRLLAREVKELRARSLSEWR